MKLNELRKLLENYDKEKSLYEKIFGDNFYIKILKDYLAKIRIPSEDKYSTFEIYFSDFKKYFVEFHYKAQKDFFADFLSSGNLAANIFNKWIEYDKNYFRFWKTPNTLHERCIQYIANAKLQNRFKIKYDNISSNLCLLIHERIKQATLGRQAEEQSFNKAKTDVQEREANRDISQIEKYSIRAERRW